MNKSVTLTRIRKRHLVLEALPDMIVIPPRPGIAGEVTKPLTEATLDDVAFAVRSVEAEFSAVIDRLHALKKLYEFARDAGALGANLAVEAVAGSQGKR
jgi:hypothetical protein